MINVTIFPSVSSLAYCGNVVMLDTVLYYSSLLYLFCASFMGENFSSIVTAITKRGSLMNMMFVVFKYMMLDACLDFCVRLVVLQLLRV